MFNSFINWIYTRTITIKRYTDVGEIKYNLSYIKTGTTYKLVGVESRLNKFVDIVLDFTDELNPYEYETKVAMINKGLEITDMNLMKKMKSVYGFDINIYNSTMDMYSHLVPKQQKQNHQKNNKIN